ncbi:MAG: undecaprenyl-diphosphate phosphatase [Bdellovibrionales bacterium]|nr:undecaprenyl-diphosphate phosphatase [Bdellovibrionales bacterium]
MSIAFAILLGLVQALTEFLPVSSSGHLVVFQVLIGPSFSVSHVPLAFDVVVHVATLLATTVYLWNDIWFSLKHLAESSAEGLRSRRLAALVAVATLPAVVVGFGLKDSIEAMFSSSEAAGVGFVVTTLVLLLSHRFQAPNATAEDAPTKALAWQFPSFGTALLIGIAQAVAICPGISRSGSTIAVALMLGLSADSAVRFSFLMSLPAILGAALLQSREIGALPEGQFGAYATGFFVAFAAGLCALRLLVFVTRRARLSYFAIYTGLLAALLLGRSMVA